MTTSIMHIDLETENNEYYGSKASPYCPDNYVVESAWRIDTTQADGTTTVGPTQSVRFNSRADFLAGNSAAEGCRWFHIPEDCWLIVAHNAAYEISWFLTYQRQQFEAFLKRGGRCSPSAAFFGSMLSIKPVLHVNAEGKLIARSKVRGRHQALRAMVQKMIELEGAKDQVIFISHGDCEEDALFVKQKLVEMAGCDPEKIVLSQVGPVIGSHSGPGTVALFFRGKDRG